MNKYHKLFIILLLVSFIVPQIVLAAWWNPFSWNIWNNIFSVFYKPQTTQTAPLSNPVVSEDASRNTETKQQPKDQILPPSPMCSPNWKCETWSLCKNSLQTRACVDANSCGALTGKPSVARFCTVSCSPSWQCSSWGVCSNSIQARTCTDLNSCGNNNGEPISSQSCSMPQATATPTGKNYYYDSLSYVKNAIVAHESFETWLQDTSNQFRSASLTLSGYNTGGLYAQDRDAAIKLANGIISVISDQITNDKQWVVYWQGFEDVLTSHSDQFISESTYNQMIDKELSTTRDSQISNIKSDINSKLDSVMTALQYH